jgi:hypothetical protein
MTIKRVTSWKIKYLLNLIASCSFFFLFRYSSISSPCALWILDPWNQKTFGEKRVISDKFNYCHLSISARY